MMGASSCEESVAEKYGIKIKENPPGSGKYVVVEDPAHGQIGATVEIAQNATSGIPIAGQVVGGLSLLSSLLYNFLLGRAKARAQEMTDQHETTHDATSLALQNFVNTQPAEVGKALIAHLDSVHDHMEIPADHQDWIQPIQKA
jgi:hypothetical protein